MSILRYIRSRPFSTMALCNIVGDFCLLGFAFRATGLVSLPKLVGALFTMIAHVILLAYGDARTHTGEDESGLIPELITKAQEVSRHLTHKVPHHLAQRLQEKPVAITFSLLAINGLGLLVDALANLTAADGLSMKLSQVAFGAVITLGCLTYAASDITGSPAVAKRRLRWGAMILTTTVIPQVGLAIASANVWLIAAIFAFVGSNLSAYYAARPVVSPQ